MASLENSIKKEIIAIQHKLFQKTEDRMLPNSFYEASITLILKPGKAIIRK